jgi:hypothetical protein
LFAELFYELVKVDGRLQQWQTLLFLTWSCGLLSPALENAWSLICLLGHYITPSNRPREAVDLHFDKSYLTRDWPFGLGGS